LGCVSLQSETNDFIVILPTVGDHFTVLSIEVTTTCLEAKKKSTEAEHPNPIASWWIYQRLDSKSHIYLDWSKDSALIFVVLDLIGNGRGMFSIL